MEPNKTTTNNKVDKKALEQSIKKHDKAVSNNQIVTKDVKAAGNKNLKGKALYDFLVKNRKELIAEKKSMPVKYSDAFIGRPSLYQTKDGKVVKAASSKEVEDNGVLRVKVVCNAAYWIDSHMDMGVAGYCDKTAKERGSKIVHLHDHIHMIEAKVGETVSVYVQDISLLDLGLGEGGTTECLVMESDVMDAYNSKIYAGYKSGKINQHSIALQYVKLSLAINDGDYKEEFATWNKYYDKVINKDVADAYGFFWVMEEIKVYENSAVLFGSNELTPTLDAKSTETEPPTDTPPPPPTKKKLAFNTIMNKN